MRKRSKCAFLATAMAATTILAAGCGNSASGGQNTADSAERADPLADDRRRCGRSNSG